MEKKYLPFFIVIGIIIASAPFLFHSLSFILKQALWFLGVALILVPLYFILPSHSVKQNLLKGLALVLILVVSVFILRMLHISISTASVGIDQSVQCPSFIGTDGLQPSYCKLFYYGGDYGSGDSLLGSVNIAPGQSSVCQYTFNDNPNGYLYGTNYCVLSEVQCPAGTSVISYNSPGFINCTQAVSTEQSTQPTSTSSSTPVSGSISAKFTVSFIGILAQLYQSIIPI